MRPRRHFQNGQAIVLLALMMAVLVGFVALAIDTARAFDSRRILQDSVDAAALTAAESYQAGAGWGTAQANAMTVFERDSRLYGGDNCPAGAFATPAIGTPVTTVCTVGSGSGYTVQIFAADYAAAGQAFVVGAIRPLPVALMQVLSGTSSISIQATGGALANDRSQTPALGALIADNTCPGGAGLNPAIHIQNRTNFMTVYGDVVSNGSLNMGGLSYLHVAGNVLTRCAPPLNPDHIAYECWQRGETPSPGCAADELAGTLYSTSNQLADPGYLPPASPAGNLGIPGSAVDVKPGIYTVDPNFGSNRCYFLWGGVYEWQGGLSVNSGLVSNELRPPDAPVYNNNTTRAPQFWDDFNSSTGQGSHQHCDGAFKLASVGTGTALRSATYGVVVTSVRTDTFNGRSYLRESPPSMCRTQTISGTNALQVVISNVPGAQSYNLYASISGGCGGSFGYFGSIANNVTELNSDVVNCPDTSAAPVCTLGQVSATFDGLSVLNSMTPISRPAVAPTSGAPPPDTGAAPFAAGLPNQSPPRAAPPAGDLGNESHCTTILGADTTCPAPHTPGATANFVTPGAVEMNVDNGGCINVNGDAFLFSGYQYNWLLNYELTSACTNNWNGITNSAAIGMSYAPAAAFDITGNTTNSNNTWSFEGPMGGILAGSIHITYSSGLVIDFDPHYAPGPGGARLIV
jgi:Flp pilus assembly protein TadG